MSPFAVTAAADSVTLKDRRGEASFTVSNTGTSTERAVGVVVVDGPEQPPAKAEWFVIDEALRTIEANGHEQYRVAIVVPPEVAAGSYGFRLRAYSAEGAPEETAETSPLVRFILVPTTVPVARPWWKLWWIYVVAAVVLLAVVAVVVLLTRGGDNGLDQPVITSPQPGLFVPCEQAACPVQIQWGTVAGAVSYLLRVTDVTGVTGGTPPVEVTVFEVVGNSATIPLVNERSYQVDVVARRVDENSVPGSILFGLARPVIAPPFTIPDFSDFTIPEFVPELIRPQN